MVGRIDADLDRVAIVPVALRILALGQLRDRQVQGSVLRHLGRLGITQVHGECKIFRLNKRELVAAVLILGKRFYRIETCAAHDVGGVQSDLKLIHDRLRVFDGAVGLRDARRRRGRADLHVSGRLRPRIGGGDPEPDLVAVAPACGIALLGQLLDVQVDAAGGLWRICREFQRDDVGRHLRRCDRPGPDHVGPGVLHKVRFCHRQLEVRDCIHAVCGHCGVHLGPLRGLAHRPVADDVVARHFPARVVHLGVHRQWRPDLNRRLPGVVRRY